MTQQSCESAVVPVRYVWLNIATGEFSNSWLPDEYSTLSQEDLILQSKQDTPPDQRPSWKLIEYRCLTDGEFQFDNNMRLP